MKSININEKVFIKDSMPTKRKGLGDTRISLYRKISEDMYEPISVGSNKIVIAGSAFLASKISNKLPKIFTRTYNDELSLDYNNPVAYDNSGMPKEEQIILFGVGDTGCGNEVKDVYKVEYKSHINGSDLIPFVVRTQAEGDISDELRETYFGRKKEGNGNIKYYFKAFTLDPEIHQEFLDGTPIDENIYVNQRKDEVQSFIRYQMDISSDDFVKFWEMNNIDERRISSITLLTGIETKVPDDNGIQRKIYQNIRPLTVYNFARENMLESKGIKIVYDIYL